MKWIMKFRWAILALWIAGAVILMFTAPNMADLVRDKGEVKLPDGYSSTLASDLQKKHNPDSKGEDYIVVYHADKALTKADKDKIEATQSKIEDNKAAYHVESVVNSFKHPELKDEFLSDDKKTLLATLTVDAGNTPVKEIRDKLEDAVSVKGLKTYLTGNALIQEDVVQNSENGLHKTEGITVIFILVVLFLVFRSVIAPFIPLLTVGITFLVSQSVVSFLVKYLDFPISTFTQIFMVCILFGIGTDYCILLMSRFKESISSGQSVENAVTETYRTAGKTVLYSGIAVLVAFMSLWFVKFDLYRSAVAVGVGIVVLLLALYTIVPFFMRTIGRALFWPLNKNIQHKESKVWGAAGAFALARPFIALLIVAVITLPPIFLHKGAESFNSLDELSDSSLAKKGFEVVSDSFGAGQVSPTQVLIENDDNLKTPEYIAQIEKISDDLASIKGVDMVMSASRPAGTRLKDIYVNQQADKVNSGVKKANNGIGDVKDGLKEAGSKLEKSGPQLDQAVSGIDKLQDGTLSTKDGLGKLQDALKQISTGIKAGSDGAGQLKSGIKTAKAQLGKLQSGNQKILAGYQEVAKNLDNINKQLNQSTNSSGDMQIDTSALENQFKKVGASLQKVAAAHPELANDPNFVQLSKDVQGLNGAGKTFQTQLKTAIGKQMAQIQGQMKQLNSGLKSLSGAMKELNAQSAKVNVGLGQFGSGLDQVSNGLDQLESGLNKAGNGQDQVINKIPQIQQALDQIAAGQGELKTGFGTMNDQIGQLSGGLKSGANGLGKIQNGLDSANGLIDDWSKEPYADSGIYVPNEIFDNHDFNQALDQYISKDGKLATINVVLTKNPYSNGAMEMTNTIKDRLDASLQGTKLENAHIGIGGMASNNHDTKLMSTHDYNLVLLIVLAAVFVVLVIVLRSLVMPIYLIASLVLTYFAAIGFTEIIFVRLLHYSGLTWATPFFGFVVLVALGIDYSIFLMMRFNEYNGMPIKERMLISMKNMGGVIFSAVIILGGTFAAMMPAGVLSLLQIATVVLIGLVLYAILLLPLFVPVMVRIFGRANWWPFITRKGDHQENSPHPK